MEVLSENYLYPTSTWNNRNKATKKHNMSPVTEPPEGVHAYTSLDEVPSDLQKYWMQRNDIFSRYDQGIWLTHDAWFGVTPEPIAKYGKNAVFSSLQLAQLTNRENLSGKLLSMLQRRPRRRRS